MNLPSSDSPIRQLFDMSHLVEILQPQRRMQLPTLREVLSRTNSREWEKGVKALHFVCMKADGSIVLERVGPKGGHKTVWTF